MTDKDLESVTSSTLSELMTLNIVLPSTYEEVFLSNAEEKNLDMSELMEISKQASNELTFADMSRLNELTKKNTELLKDNINQAKNAIVNQDMDTLNNIQEEMSLLEQEMAILKEQLHTDELTKTYNRKWLFEEFLTEEMFNKNGAIAFISIDGFQDLVNKYGYAVGDRILIYMAEIFKKIPFSSEIRFSEEKFLIISTKVNKDVLASKLKKSQEFLSLKTVKLKKDSFKVNFSFNIDSFESGEPFLDVLNRINKIN